MFALTRYRSYLAALLLFVIVPTFCCVLPSCSAYENSLLQTRTGAVLSSSKAALIPVPERLQVVYDLQLSKTGSGWNVSWRGRLPGDYNQDGIVNISDITPLAMHWQGLVSNAPELEVVDGNSDGMIGIADITTIAQGFSISANVYELSLATEQSGPYSYIASVAYNSYIPPLVGYANYSIAITTAQTTGFLRVSLLTSDTMGMYDVAIEPLE